MIWFGKVEKNWLRSVLFLGSNSMSLIGGALASASAFILLSFWIVDFLGHGGSTNPYLGIVLDLFLPRHAPIF